MDAAWLVALNRFVFRGGDMRLSFPRRCWEGIVVALAIATSTALADEPATESPLAAARVLLNQGKYAEAQEAFEALAAQQPAPAAVGVARSLEATGAAREGGDDAH